VFIAEELQRNFTQVFILRGLRRDAWGLVVRRRELKAGKHRRVTTKESDEVNVDRGRGLNEVRAENGGARRAKGDGLPKNMREYSI
jgi:hypothetical protein